MFGSWFLDNSSIDFKKFYSFGKGDSMATSFLMWCIRHFCFLTLQLGSREPIVVYALHKWLIKIFSRTTEASNPQVHISITPEGIYICAGNDVISCFRSAANRVHATTAITDFTMAKRSSWKISESTKASIFKMCSHIALGSPYILIRNDVTIYFRSAPNRTNVSIWGHIRVVISR